MADPKYPLEQAREEKLRKYEGRLNADVALIPLVVTTFGAWEDDAAANLRDIAVKQAENIGIEKKVAVKRFFERLSVSLYRDLGNMLLSRSPIHSLHPSQDGIL